MSNNKNNDNQTSRPSDNQQKRRTRRIVDFAVPADRVKLRESEKWDKYVDLARELKKHWNMKVTEISIVIGALSTVTKGLVKGPGDLEIRGRVETIQTTVLLRSARILKRFLEIWEDLLSFRLQGGTRMWKTLKRV